MKKTYLIISASILAVTGLLYWFFEYEKPKQDKLSRTGIVNKEPIEL